MEIGVFQKFTASFELTRSKMRAGAVVGLGGFPLYYFIWQDVFPQGYENALLRALCVGVLVCWLVVDRFAPDRSRAFQVLSYVTLTTCLPFFFCYMFLQNNASGIWLGSMICGMLYLAVAVEISNFFMMFLLGSLAAVATYMGLPHNEIDPYRLYETAPVILFAFGGGLILKFAEEWTIHHNQKRAVALAGSIAHELRTPLLGIRLELENFSKLCRDTALTGGTDNARHCDEISGRVNRHVLKASHMVECLLLNVRDEAFDSRGFTYHSMQTVLDDVFARYPLTEREREIIRVREHEDFTFWGDSLLMSHVVMNLLKNAFEAIASAEKGQVEIYFSRIEGKNAMCVRDTGRGIAADARTKIFERFYSNTQGGAGLGLAFCKRVIDSFGGALECKSEAGEYTEFRIWLPAGEAA